MAKLRLHVVQGDKLTTLHFSALPVLIGRDPSCQCRLEFPWVSRQHAVLEEIDGRIVLRDAGSRRGTWILRGARSLEAGESIDLAAIGQRFSIGALDIQVEVDTVAAEEIVEPEVTTHAAMMATCGYADANVDPSALDAAAVERALREALDDQRRTLTALDTVLRQAQACGSEHLARFASIVVGHDAEWDGRATTRQFVTASGIRPAPARPDATALCALQEIAATHVPYAPPLAASEAIIEFASRVDQVLTLLLEGAASLHYALERETGRADVPPPARGDLAAALLDWTNDRPPLAELRNVLERMLTHHHRLVGGVAEGLERLLVRLHPWAIEAEHGAPSPWRPWRALGAWREYRRRFAALADARERALGPIWSCPDLVDTFFNPVERGMRCRDGGEEEAARSSDVHRRVQG